MGKDFFIVNICLPSVAFYALRLLANSLPPAEFSRRGHVARARRFPQMDTELHERSPEFGDNVRADAEVSRKRIRRRGDGRAEGRRGLEVEST